MRPPHAPPSRREVLVAGIGAALAPSLSALAQAPTPGPRMLTRPIPSSGEALPVIGMGTWQTFDVGAPRTNARPWPRSSRSSSPRARGSSTPRPCTAAQKPSWATC
ncbi:hypothetical protein [Corallococcus sp. 4LFB]|uniref:hypothetical protein n=1 Tax=Corallococcus sp. 4LFB TaxID=3383249 RepID=UPI00397626AB